MKLGPTALAALIGSVASSVDAQTPGLRTTAEREAAYATSVSQLADSAIRRLDFFPARAQVRAQMLSLTPHDSAIAIFSEISRRSRDAALSLDEIAQHFEATPVPDDLGDLHRRLLGALRDARTALARLERAASACTIDPSSSTRCQGAFGSASSAVAQAYAQYLDVRAKIRDQVTDTRTVLPEFRLANRGR
jgi:hypothetical protein